MLDVKTPALHIATGQKVILAIIGEFVYMHLVLYLLRGTCAHVRGPSFDMQIYAGGSGPCDRYFFLTHDIYWSP